MFTGLSLNATRDQIAAARQQNTVSEQGQFTDRYTKAVEQLDQAGDDHLQGRLGAIYALERLARDSPRDQPTIVEILSAFVRTSRPTPTVRVGARSTCPASQPLTPDVQAALTVLGRRNHARDNGARTDLDFTCLDGTILVDLKLRGARLAEAGLEAAFLLDVDLRGADLSWANLRGARVNADLAGADLEFADLRGADLFGDDLRDAHLFKADLRGAKLLRADLRGANLSYVDLRGASLYGADLRGADLTGAIRDARTDVDETSTDSRTRGRWW